MTHQETQEESPKHDDEKTNWRGCALLFTVLALIPSVLFVGVTFWSFRVVPLSEPISCERDGLRLTQQTLQSGADVYQQHTFVDLADEGQIFQETLREPPPVDCERNMQTSDAAQIVWGGRNLARNTGEDWRVYAVCDVLREADIRIFDCDDEPIFFTDATGDLTVTITHEDAMYTLALNGGGWQSVD